MGQLSLLDNIIPADVDFPAPALGRGRKSVIPVVDGQPSRPMPVETGVRGFDTTEIISGVEEGAEVLVMTPGQGPGGGMPEWLRDRMKNKKDEAGASAVEGETIPPVEAESTD